MSKQRLSCYLWTRQIAITACQGSHVQAASSGIAALSPALFTRVASQHLTLTTGMSYRCRSHRKWPEKPSLQSPHKHSVYVSIHLH
ncbi:hypothetical protein NL108_006178 [Boleophthalmus pectinirostris]|nr:hypothetical protein NL108_006178 [Boleophthalmus pectinirostris]